MTAPAPADATAHVHLVVAALRADAPAALVAAALQHAGALAEAPGATAVRVAHSNAQLIVATWLRSDTPLEVFAASPQHMAFVMQGLAPVVHSMWSVAIASATPPPPAAGGLLWACALPVDAPLFEPQVRELLAALAQLGGPAAAGPTVEERERVRAGALVWIAAAAAPAFDVAVGRLLEAWRARGAALVHARAEQAP